MFPRRTRVSFIAFLAITVTLVLFGLLLLLLPQRSTAQSQPEALGSLRGIVRNTQGDPLPNITVSISYHRTQNEFRHVTSNGAGVYEFLSLPSGTYTLRFEDNNKQYATKYYVAADFAIDATNVVINGNDIGNVDMELAQGGAISLTLQSSSPITMTTYYPSLYSRTLNGTWLPYKQASAEVGKNSYMFDGLPTGNYRLCATVFDYYTGYQGNECYENIAFPLDIPTQHVENATDISVQAGQTTPISIDFDDMPQLEGTILSPSNQPLAGISVRLYHTDSYPQYDATTDEHGYFRFSYVEPGIYYLIYNAPGGIENRYLPTYYPNEETTATMTQIQVERTSHFSSTTRLRAAAYITGHVALPGNAPVTWATVSVFRQAPNDMWYRYDQCPTPFYYYCFPPSTYDPTTGVYTVTNLIPGDYRLGADAYLPNTQFTQFAFYGGDSLEEADTVSVSRGQTVGGIDIEGGEGKFDGVISGQVTAEGQPVAGIEVGLFTPYNQYYMLSAMPDFTTMTDAQGRYALEGLSAGNYVVGAYDPKGMYATTFYLEGPFVDYVPPVPGTTLWYSGTNTLDNIDMTLSPGATIRGHIRVQGQMDGDYLVQLVNSFQPYSDPIYNMPIAYADEKSDANGFFEITGVNPGNYYLRVYSPADNNNFNFYNPTFYPGTQDANFAQTITVAAGQTLTGKDIYVYDTPTIFIPAIVGESDDPAAGLPPTPVPPIGVPITPTYVPTPTPMIP